MHRADKQLEVTDASVRGGSDIELETETEGQRIDLYNAKSRPFALPAHWYGR